VTDRWIVVPSWERFQHRDAARAVVPAWIKVYPSLLSHDAFLELTPHRRALLLGVWLEYARTRRQLPEDTAKLSRRLAQRVLRRDLEALNDAGFIAFSASRPASDAAGADASLEIEIEKKDPLTPSPSEGDASNNASNNASGPRPAATCHECGEPVEVGRHCPACGASPRAAGSNSRRARRAASTPYQRAEAMTRNEGREYPLDAYREELDRFELSAGERDLLEELWARLVDEDEALAW
jgi:hypothetical protein